MNYKINVKGIGKSKLITHAYLIPKINIDNYNLYNIKFLSKKKNFLFYYLGIDGIIGWDILKNLNFFIDFKNKYFNIDISDTRKKNYDFYLSHTSIIKDKKLVIETIYNKKIVPTLIDLGANNSVISDELLSGDEEIKIKKNFIFGINGVYLRKVSEIKQLSIGIGLQNIDIQNTIIKNFKYNWLLKLGTDSFMNHILYFDNIEGEVLFIE